MTHSAELALQPTVRLINVIRITIWDRFTIKKIPEPYPLNKYIPFPDASITTSSGNNQQLGHLTRSDIYMKFSATGARPKETSDQSIGN